MEDTRPSGSPRVAVDDIGHSHRLIRSRIWRLSCRPRRHPGRVSANLSRCSISDGVSSKSKMAAFSAIRSAFVDFGIATIRCSMCQRRTTWAG